VTTAKQNMTEYLNDRGIAAKYAEQAGAKAVSRTMARCMGFPLAAHSNGGVVFPYLHPLNHEPHSTLMRIRYFDPGVWIDARGKATSFFGEGCKTRRYMQPKGSGVEAFFDANVDWMAVFRDQTISIRIVEGEAKALYMNQHWRTMNRTVSVGLGGVCNFREQNGEDLTPWLRMVRAASQGSRKIIITFDDDAVTNPDIQKSERELARLLNVSQVVTGGELQ
jgi:hypothetical protein